MNTRINPRKESQVNKALRITGKAALGAAGLAGYLLAPAMTHSPLAVAAEPGGSVHAPSWLQFQHATKADERHFHVRGKCVIELTGSGHGWILCRDGQSASIPGSVSEPHKITLVSGRTGLAVERIAWQSAGRASAELDATGDGAANLGKVNVTVTRDQGAITALKLAGDTQGVAKSWTFSHGHWNGS